MGSPSCNPGGKPPVVTFMMYGLHSGPEYAGPPVPTSPAANAMPLLPGPIAHPPWLQTKFEVTIAGGELVAAAALACAGSDEMSIPRTMAPAATTELDQARMTILLGYDFSIRDTATGYSGLNANGCGISVPKGTNEARLGQGGTVPSRTDERLGWLPPFRRRWCGLTFGVPSADSFDRVLWARKQSRRCVPWTDREHPNFGAVRRVLTRGCPARQPCGEGCSF